MRHLPCFSGHQLPQHLIQFLLDYPQSEHSEALGLFKAKPEFPPSDKTLTVPMAYVMLRLIDSYLLTVAQRNRTAVDTLRYYQNTFIYHAVTICQREQVNVGDMSLLLQTLTGAFTHLHALLARLEDLPVSSTDKDTLLLEGIWGLLSRPDSADRYIWQANMLVMHSQFLLHAALHNEDCRLPRDTDKRMLALWWQWLETCTHHQRLTYITPEGGLRKAVPAIFGTLSRRAEQHVERFARINMAVFTKLTQQLGDMQNDPRGDSYFILTQNDALTHHADPSHRAALADYLDDLSLTDTFCATPQQRAA